MCCLVRTRSDRYDANSQNFHGANQTANNPGPRQSYNYNPVQGPPQHSQQYQNQPTLTISGSGGTRFDQYNNTGAPGLSTRLDSSASRGGGGGRSSRENGNAHSPDSLDFPQLGQPDSLNSPGDSSTGGFVVVQHISDRNPDDNENDPADNARLETLFLLKAQNEMRRSAPRVCCTIFGFCPASQNQYHSHVVTIEGHLRSSKHIGAHTYMIN